MGQAWFDGLGGVLNGLARDIRRELEREPDRGDLLIALACAPNTLASQALRELGVNVQELPGVIERVRPRRRPSAEAHLTGQIEDARRPEELAIKSPGFQTTAGIRDQEQELTQQARANAVVAPEVIHEIRRHIGIPIHPLSSDPAQARD